MCLYIWICLIDNMFNVGKLNRGLSVVDTIRILKGDAVTDDDIFKATVLGWLVEFVCFIDWLHGGDVIKENDKIWIC